MSTVNFFGYGLLSDRSTIREIIGRDPGIGRSAIIQGFQLVYQILPQIPKDVRKTLEHIWGNDFKAYTLHKGNGVVAGVIWELSEKELEKIRAWEFVGSWRESRTATVITNDGDQVPVTVIKVPDTQQFEEIVNGLRYETNLNHKYKVKDESKEQDAELLTAVRRQIEELAAQNAYGKQGFA